MIPIRRRSQGVTILEIILVLIIGMSIIYLSLLQYQAYRRDVDMQQLRANVDTLFFSLAEYFKANCTGPDFNPNATGYTNNPNVRVRISDLRAEGFLQTDLPYSPFVNYGPPAREGYILQYNLTTPFPTRTVNMGGGTTTDVGKIVIWRAQVAVQLKGTYPPEALKSGLTADCLSSMSGTFVLSCANASGTKFAVWERLPSLASSEANSPLWLTMPTVKQFTQMYTTDPILILTDPNQSQLAKQYYICGS